MGKETFDVFVSYARADWRSAVDIDSALRAGGLKSFFDRANLPVGLRDVPAWRPGHRGFVDVVGIDNKGMQLAVERWLGESAGRQLF